MKKINLFFLTVVCFALMIVSCDVDEITSNINETKDGEVTLVINCDVKIPTSQELKDVDISGYDYLDTISLKKSKENISHAYVYFNYNDVDDAFTNEIFDADFSITNVNADKRSGKIVVKVVNKKLVADNGRKFYICFVNDSNGTKIGNNIKSATIVNASEILNYDKQIKVGSKIEFNAICDGIYANVNFDAEK